MKIDHEVKPQNQTKSQQKRFINFPGHRMANMCGVHTNLMFSTCENADGHQAQRIILSEVVRAVVVYCDGGPAKPGAW